MISVSLLQEVCAQAVIFSLPTLAAFVTSHALCFDDLSIEGSFSGGCGIAALCAVQGYSCFVILCAGMIAGALVGSITALLHVQGKVEKILSGLAVSTGMFSVMLATVGPYQCIPISAVFPSHAWPFLMLFAISITGMLCFFMTTPFGLFIHASGHNRPMVTNLGKSPGFFLSAGLIVTGSLSGLSGALFCLHNGFFSITSSVGVLVVALAGMILGTQLRPGLSLALLAGPFVYQAVFALIISLGVPGMEQLITRSFYCDFMLCSLC